MALGLLRVVDDAPQHVDHFCDGGLDIRVELGELVRLQHERVERANLEFGDREGRDSAGVGRDGGPQGSEGVGGVIGGVDGRGEGDEEVGGARHCAGRGERGDGRGGAGGVPVRGGSRRAGAGGVLVCGADWGERAWIGIAGRGASRSSDVAGWLSRAWRSSQRRDPVP